MRSSKRTRTTPTKKIQPNVSNLKSKTLFNIDVYNVIISNLTIFEIIFSLLTVNTTLYNFIKSDTKSLNTINRCICYDYGKIRNDENFTKLFKNQKFKKSYKMIHKFDT